MALVGGFRLGSIFFFMPKNGDFGSNYCYLGRKIERHIGDKSAIFAENCDHNWESKKKKSFFNGQEECFISPVWPQHHLRNYNSLKIIITSILIRLWFSRVPF
jgi:hypothetical protein